LREGCLASASLVSPSSVLWGSSARAVRALEAPRAKASGSAGSLSFWIQRLEAYINPFVRTLFSGDVGRANGELTGIVSGFSTATSRL
jgi:hypothetical protein